MRSCLKRTLALAVLMWVTFAANSFAGTPRISPEAKYRSLNYDSVVSEQVPPVNDQCSGAIQIPCGNIFLQGHTAEANNDYTLDSLFSCTNYTANGRDVVYRLDVVAGDSLWVDYNSSGTDPSIYMVTDCSNPTGTCVVGSDSALAGRAESIRYKFTSPGTYFLILDSFGPQTSGAWTLSGQLVCGASPPPSNDICANAPRLGCGIFSLSGSTLLASDDYTFTDSQSSCFGQVADGADVVYRLEIEPGDKLSVDYFSQANGSVYLVTDCSDPEGTCVAGVDDVGESQTEKLRYTFSFAGTYYLIFDSREANSSGNWSAIGELTCANPPPVNDRCSDALSINCGPINMSGTTALARNDYFVTGIQNSCTKFAIDGNDVVYRLFVRDGYHLSVNFTPSTYDGAIYLVSQCDSIWAGCLHGVDAVFEGETETLEYTFNYTGVAYLILDAFDTNAGGAWTLSGSLTCVSLDVPSEPLALELRLSEAFPNPFHERTTLRYTLPSTGRARIGIYDLQGRMVRTLVDRDHPPGRYHAVWDGRSDSGAKLEPGVYMAKLLTGGGEAVQRVIFVR